MLGIQLNAAGNVLKELNIQSMKTLFHSYSKRLSSYYCFTPATCTRVLEKTLRNTVEKNILNRPKVQ